MVHRLAAEGEVRPGWSPERALDVPWLLTSFQTYGQLSCRSGQTCDQAGEMVFSLAGCAVDGLE